MILAKIFWEKKSFDFDIVFDLYIKYRQEYEFYLRYLNNLK